MEFIQYFGNVFEPYNFAILVLGTIGGLLLGATPGLSPTMTVALLIPFTFHMSSVSGLILLGAAYTSSLIPRNQTCYLSPCSRYQSDNNSNNAPNS